MVVNLLRGQTWKRIGNVDCSGIEEHSEANVPAVKPPLHDAIEKVDVGVIDAITAADDELALLERIVGEANTGRKVFLVGMTASRRRKQPQNAVEILVVLVAEVVPSQSRIDGQIGKHFPIIVNIETQNLAGQVSHLASRGIARALHQYVGIGSI